VTPRYLLDTSAMMALLLNEPGQERVAQLLRDAAEKRCMLYLCFISKMELEYTLLRLNCATAVQRMIAGLKALPMQVVPATDSLMSAAALIKLTQQLSLADALIAAAAQLVNATLVHKDPEFENLQGITQEWLPLKPKRKAPGKPG
jgi:predicted nucleic acid-binding protein